MSGTLVFIGDSLTEWYDWQRRFPADRVLNLGISGETIGELLDRRDRVRRLAGTPDVVFLMSGINDLLQEHYSIADPYREVVRNYTTWWKSAVVVVQSLLPVDYPWISNDMVRNVNRELAAIARDHGAHYLDLFAAFIDSSGRTRNGLLSDDGVHLSGKGYEVWAREVEVFLSTGLTRD